MPNWVTLGSSDTIEDIYEDDGTEEVKIVLNIGGTFTSTNATVLEGARHAKSAKAAGGSDVTIKADLNTGTSEIDGISYSLSG